MEGKRILGIDPGSGKLGHALIEVVNGKAVLIGHGCIETTPNSPETQKLSHIYDALVHMVNEIKPDLIAVEMLFFASNVTTAFSVGQARGVVLLVAAQANIPTAEIAPLRLKKLLMGNGSVKKRDIQVFVKNYFGLEKAPKDDAADAIAIALTQVFAAA